jgi:rod shape determining protein RodA
MRPDLGTAILIALTGVTIVVLAGPSWKIIAAGALSGGRVVRRSSCS